MNMGGQLVVFVTVTENLAVRDKYNKPTLVRTEVSVPGCRFRPLKASEKIDLGLNTLKDPWKCTAPPVAAVMAMTSIDEVKCDGITYQVVGGDRTYPGMNGRPYKATLYVERQEG